jgi:hypothetical protein
MPDFSIQMTVLWLTVGNTSESRIVSFDNSGFGRIGLLSCHQRHEAPRQNQVKPGYVFRSWTFQRGADLTLHPPYVPVLSP